MYVFFMLTNQHDILPNGRTTITWINYGCIHAALVLFMITPFLYPRKIWKDVSMPMYSLTFGFWWFELILSTILIFFVTIPEVYNILIQVICWGVVMAKIIVLALVDTDTDQKQQRHEQELLYVKTVASLLKTRLDNETNKEEYRKLEQLYDYIRTSPVKSNSMAQSLELQIIQMISSLISSTDNVDTSALYKEIMRLAQQRNQIIAINNKTL